MFPTLTNGITTELHKWEHGDCPWQLSFLRLQLHLSRSPFDFLLLHVLESISSPLSLLQASPGWELPNWPPAPLWSLKPISHEAPEESPRCHLCKAISKASYCPYDWKNKILNMAFMSPAWVALHGLALLHFPLLSSHTRFPNKLSFLLPLGLCKCALLHLCSVNSFIIQVLGWPLVPLECVTCNYIFRVW